MSPKMTATFDERMTLIQLGFTKEQIACLEDIYFTGSEQISEPFVEYSLAFSGGGEFTLIDLGWLPSEKIKQKLIAEGYSENLIHHAARIFVLKVRENQSVLINPDKAFAAYMSKTYSFERVGVFSKAMLAELQLKGLSNSDVNRAVRSIETVVESDLNCMSEAVIAGMVKGLIAAPHY